MRQLRGVPVVVDADPSAFQSYRAPAENGQAFVYPSSGHLPETTAENHARLGTAGVAFGNHDFAEVRGRSRASLLECLAKDQQTGIWSSPQNSDKGLFILGGHQPELYHAGVWFKNFFISALAASMNASAVNLRN